MSSVFLFLLIALTSTNLAEAGKLQYPQDHAENLFEEYIVEYEKVYQNEEEKRMRFEIFQNNLKKINENNANEEDSVEYGINQFTDMTLAEFKKTLGLKKPDNIKKKAYNMTGSAPDAMDWRDKGVVSPVKNQKQCGSCWAFSATGHLESQYAIKNGKIVLLSEQQLVDCDKNSIGCKGGLMENAYEYVKANGLMSEDDYPYVARQGDCHQDPSKAVLKVTDYASHQFQSDDELKDLVATKGPISVAVCALDFHNYQSGIWKQSCDVINHGVLVVGYGEEQGTPYWIIKNSWGSKWGEQGYIRLLRGSNVCHVLDDASCVNLE